MKERSVWHGVSPLLALAVLVAGCGAPGRGRARERRGQRDCGEGRRRRRPAPSRSRSGTRRSAAARRSQIEAAQRGVPGQVPERDDQAGREVVHRPQHDAQARGVRATEGARRRAGQPGPPGDGRARQGRPAASARRLRRGLRLGRPLRRRCCWTSTASPRDGEKFGAGDLYGALADGRDRRRLLQQGQGPAAARRRSPSSRSMLRPGQGRAARCRSRSATSTSGPASTSSRRSRTSSRRASRCATSCSRATAPRSPRPENEEAATKLQDWAEKGYFTKDFNGIGYDPAWQQFAKGDGPFLIAGTWLTADLADAMGDNVGFILTPAEERARPVVARRREPAVGDHREVREPRRRGGLHRLPHRRRTPRGACPAPDNLPAMNGRRAAARRGLARTSSTAWTDAQRRRRPHPVPRLRDADVLRRLSPPASSSCWRAGVSRASDVRQRAVAGRTSQKFTGGAGTSRPPGEPRRVALPVPAARARGLRAFVLRRWRTRRGSRCSSGTA